jgi:hypothetical protein
MSGVLRVVIDALNATENLTFKWKLRVVARDEFRVDRKCSQLKTIAIGPYA